MLRLLLLGGLGVGWGGSRGGLSASWAVGRAQVAGAPDIRRAADGCEGRTTAGVAQASELCGQRVGDQDGSRNARAGVAVDKCVGDRLAGHELDGCDGLLDTQVRAVVSPVETAN